MTEASTIEQLLAGLARLLDERPDLRARVAVVELSRDGMSGVLPAPGGLDVDGALLSPGPYGSMPGTNEPTRNDDGLIRTKFNLAGHAVIAYVAEQFLEANDHDAWQALQNVKAADPLARGDIGSCAMWPDQLKHPPPGTQAAFAKQQQRLGGKRNTWHFVNIPFDPAHKNAKPHLASVSGDLLRQLPGQIALLSSSDELAAADALCFVLHLMGDLHQPLHCAALADGQFFTTPPEFDQGGNLIRWGTDAPRGSNLHSLWDDAIAGSQGDVVGRVQATLSDFPKSHFTAKQLGLGLEDIALETFALAKRAYEDFLADTTYQGQSQAVNGGQQFSSPSPQYRKNARDVCRERAALAGYRLARVIATALKGAPKSNGTGGAKPKKRRRKTPARPKRK